MPASRSAVTISFKPTGFPARRKASRIRLPSSPCLNSFTRLRGRLMPRLSMSKPGSKIVKRLNVVQLLDAPCQLLFQFGNFAGKCRPPVHPPTVAAASFCLSPRDDQNLDSHCPIPDSYRNARFEPSQQFCCYHSWPVRPVALAPQYRNGTALPFHNLSAPTGWPALRRAMTMFEFAVIPDRRFRPVDNAPKSDRRLEQLAQ